MSFLNEMAHIEYVLYSTGNNTIEKGIFYSKVLPGFEVLAEIDPLGDWMSPDELTRHIKFVKGREGLPVFEVRDIQRGGPNGITEASGSYSVENGLPTRLE